MLPRHHLYQQHTLSEPLLSPDGNTLFYARSAEGRHSLVRQSLATGFAQPVTAEPPPSGGLSYGGGLYGLHGDLLAYAGRDGRVWGLNLTNGEQWPISPVFDGVACPIFAPDGRFVAFVAEQSQFANVMLADSRGQDFPVKLSQNPWYAFNPAFSPDGASVAWMDWDFEFMPWDEARLVLARLAKPASQLTHAAHALPAAYTTLSRPHTAYASPQFSPDGRWLAYTSDETGWRSLWVARLEADGRPGAAERVDTGPGEIGGPDWVPGILKMRWAADSRALYCLRRHQSRVSLLRVAWPDAAVEEIETGWPHFAGLAIGGGRLAFLAASPTQPEVVATFDLPAGPVVPRAPTSIGLLDPAALSQPEVISWPTAGGQTAWGLFYPAKAEAGPRPLIVHVHGGPTSERLLTWETEAQYFATRGWHFLMVNYRGGTGFGRAYQDMLAGQWGVVDVEDARSGAEHLVNTGQADPQRLVIYGGSAGGYTTLLALTQDPDFWTAGVSHHGGISHLYDLQQGAHRFEVNYNASLVGKLPEAAPVWKARSALTHAARVRAPVILFHGREDKAVPFQQSVDFAEAVRRHGGVAECYLYDDEGHGLTGEAAIKDRLDRIDRFLDKYVLNRQG